MHLLAMTRINFIHLRVQGNNDLCQTFTCVVYKRLYIACAFSSVGSWAGPMAPVRMHLIVSDHGVQNGLPPFRWTQEFAYAPHQGQEQEFDFKFELQSPSLERDDSIVSVL